MTSPSNVTAVGKLILDASAVRSGVAQANQSLASLYNIVRDNWWGIRAIGDAFQSVGAAINGGLGVAVSAAASFEQQMAAVGRTTYDANASVSANAKATGELGDQLKKLAETKPVDLKTITGIATEAGALGVARKDVAEFTGTIVDLITTTDLTAESATSLAKVGNIYNLTGDQFKQLGSAVFQVGRQTNATETDIVNLATRLAPAAQQIGLTAAQMTGLAAATLSAGVAPEAAGTALSRFFQTLQQAGDGLDPKKLQIFADVAGTTAQQFALMVKNEPSTALTDFISNLNNYSARAGGVTKVLADLGITETREIRTLTSLGETAQNTSNQYATIGGAIQTATAAYNDGNEASKASAAQAQTLAAQIQELRNVVNNFAIDFGTELISPLKGGIVVARDFAEGIEALPAPLKATIDYVGVAAGGLAALAAVMLLFGPRVTLAVNAYRQLTASLSTTVAASRAYAAQQGINNQGEIQAAFYAGRNSSAIEAQNAVKARQAALITVVAQLRRAELAALIQSNELEAIEDELIAATNAGNAEQITLLTAKYRAKLAEIQATDANIVALTGEEAALAGTTVEMGAASVAANVFGRAIGALGGPIGILLTLLALGVTALTIFGNKQKDAATDTDLNKKAQDDLTQAILAQASGVQGSIQTLLAQKLAMDGTGASAQQFGLTYKDLISAITGQAGGSAGKVFDVLQLSAKNGNDSAKALLKTLSQYQEQFGASATAAAQLAKAQQELGGKITQTSQDISDQEADTRSATQVLDDMANATANLAGDYLSVQSAQLSYKQAQQDLATAQQKTAESAQDAAEKELAVESARLQVYTANKTLQQSELDLQNARKNAALQLQQDTLSEEDAASAYAASKDAVTNAEKALAAVQDGSREKNLIDLTNKLTDARNALKNATISEKDAEANLAYLKAEGASARDIADATNALTDAKAGVNDAKVGVTSASDALTDAKRVSQAQALAAAQRAVEDALRQQQEDYLKLQESQAKVLQDQKDIANDTAYKDALNAEQQAALGVKQANAGVTDALQAQADAAKKTATSATELAQKQLAVQQAALSLAQAQANLTDDEATASGKYLTAEDRLKTLETAMANLGITILQQLRPQVQGVSKDIDNIKNKSVKVSVDPSAAIAGYQKAAAAADDFTTHAIEAYNNLKAYYKANPIDNPANLGIPGYGDPLGTNTGQPTHNVAAGRIFSTPTMFNFGGENYRMGEAGSEAVLPLHDLWGALAPLNNLLSQLMLGVQQASNSPAAASAGQTGNVYNNEINVQAHTDADVALIGKDIAWELKHNI
jgi:TP901 family phage tail tape measure protein